jgi:hypothetical protein
MKHRRIKVDPKKQIGAKSNTTLFIFVSFAAILSIVILGYLKLSDNGSDTLIQVEKEKDRVLDVVPTMSLKERIKQKVREELPNGGEGMVPPSTAELYGRWYTNIAPEGIAEFTFTTNGYELVYVDSPQSPLRKFSVGKYNYDPNTGDLGLFPEYNAMLAHPQRGADYKVMTTRNFQMVISQKSGDTTLYMTAHERDLAGKNYHPIFLFEAYDKVPVLKFIPVSTERK